MYHPWVENPPTKSWFHGTLDNHLYAKHDKSVLLDPYIDSTTYKNIKEGWFVTEMPDLNQSNSFVKNYLIQNTIWWIEYSGLDGIREDTYPYVNQHFLSEWAKSIFEEYPDFNIVGEVWINEPAFIAPFQRSSKVALKEKTYLPSVTDFALMESISKVVQGKQSISSIYKCLSKDYLYDDPNMLVTFLDNHDVMRLWDLTEGDVNRYKMALVLLFTLRGIPQIYYGTEIGLPGGDDHGWIRRLPGRRFGNYRPGHFYG
jgi:glycosidase